MIPALEQEAVVTISSDNENDYQYREGGGDMQQVFVNNCIIQ